MYWCLYITFVPLLQSHHIIIAIIKNAGLGYSVHLVDLLNLHHEGRTILDTFAAIADLMNKDSNSFLSPSSNQREHEQHSAAITDNYSPPCVYGIHHSLYAWMSFWLATAIVVQFFFSSQEANKQKQYP